MWLVYWVITNVDIQFRQVHYRCRHPVHIFLVVITDVAR